MAGGRRLPSCRSRRRGGPGGKGVLAAAALAWPLSAAAQPPAPPGASSCSGCHAPTGVGAPLAPILGRDAGDIVAAMQDFRAGRRPATVMDRIARGFSDDEIQAIAGWLAAQH